MKRLRAVDCNRPARSRSATALGAAFAILAFSSTVVFGQNAEPPKERTGLRGRLDDVMRRARFDDVTTSSSENPTPKRIVPDTAKRMQLLVDMGHAKEREGNSEGAIVDYQRALELGHGAKGPFKSSAQAAAEAAAHHRLAVTSDKLGRFPRADEHYQLALKLRPNDATFWNDAGYSDLMQGRFPEAERKLRHALKLAPSETRAANNLGLVLAATDRIDEAIELMSAHSGPAAAHANIAYVLAANGNKAEARSHYLKALELQPTLAIARDALAALDRPGAARTESLVAAPGTAAPAGSAGMVSGVVNTRDAGTVRASVPKAR